MNGISLRPDDLSASSVSGRVLARDLRDTTGRIAFHKGHVFSETDVAALGSLPWEALHLIAPDGDDVHEVKAGARMAAALAGPGVEPGDPSAGHWPLFATTRGIVAVDVPALAGFNRIGGLCAYTVLDGQVVDARECIARAKIVPLVIPAATLARGEAVARAAHGVVAVRPFRPLTVAAVVQESLGASAMARVRTVLDEKVAWFGGLLRDPVFVPAEAGAIARAVQREVDAGAAIVTIAGSRVMDPLDPVFDAIGRAGGEMIRVGIPAHPGSLCWVARAGHATLVGMPSCGLFSRATVFDVILAELFTGATPDDDSLAAVGHGGLFSRDLAFRLPPYRRARDRGEVA